MNNDEIKFMGINTTDSQNEEDIHFVDISPNDAKATEKNAASTPKLKYIPKPEGCNTTLDEILERCNPANFMEPYDKEMVDKANEIYTQAIALKESGEESSRVKALRNEAIEQLGVDFSTEELYKELTKYCDPRKYADKNNYDAAKVSLANKWYANIIENGRNIKELERIRKEAEIFINERIREEEERKRVEEEDRKAREEKEEKERMAKAIIADKKEEQNVKLGIILAGCTSLFVGFSYGSAQGIVAFIAVSAIMYIAEINRKNELVWAIISCIITIIAFELVNK